MVGSTALISYGGGQDADQDAGAQRWVEEILPTRPKFSGLRAQREKAHRRGSASPKERCRVGAGATLCGWALGEFADQEVALQGNLDEADAHQLSPRSFLGAGDLAGVLDAVAETAGLGMALAPADRAETLLDTDVGPDHDTLLRAVTLLLARQGHAERAMALADRIDPDLRAGWQAQIVGELARYGETSGAETLAHSITDHRAQARALIEVVRELARRGDLVRAEALTHSIAYRATRARALAGLAELSEPSHARRLAARVVLLEDKVPGQLGCPGRGSDAR
jgi:hypothetical protein